MLFLGLKHTRLAVILAVIITVLSGASAHASWQYINNYTIRETVDQSNTSTSSTQYRYFTTTDTPGDVSDTRTFDFGSSDAYCSNKIEVSGGRYNHIYQLSTGDGGCGDQRVVQITVDYTGSSYFFYQADASTITSLMPGKSDTFKKVFYQIDGSPSASQIYVQQNGGTCPGLLLTNNNTDWRFMKPPTATDGVTTTDDESLVYKDIVRAAGHTGVDLCDLSDDDDVRDNSEVVLNQLIGGGVSYWEGGGTETSWYALQTDPHEGVKKIGKAVGPRTAAVLVLGEAEEGSTGEGSTLGVGSEDVTSTCGVDEVGWAVCPLLNFIGKLNDMAFATLSGTFLETPSSLINDADTLAAWRNFRDIANALFIIAFLFMVYSQMAGGRGGR